MNKKLHIGKRIKAFRLTNQMTQTQVAGFLSVSRATIARLERGENCNDLTRARIEQRIASQEKAA